MSGRVPAEVFPPGEFIRDELEARGWTQGDLAEILGRPLRLVNEIISGKKAITPETAQGLGAAFGTGAQFWMNLESSYRLSKASNGSDDVARKAKLYEAAPVNDMIRRGWILKTRDVGELESQVFAFFQVTNVEEIGSLTLPAAARQSTSYSGTTPSHLAWLFRVKHLASQMAAGEFKADRLPEMLGKLRGLRASEEGVTKVGPLLAEYGIRLVIVEHLPRTKIDGAAIWLAPDRPAIAISLRFDRLDAFWFTLAHELGHIYYEHAKEDPAAAAIDADMVGEKSSGQDDRPQSERQADEFAISLLVPRSEMNAFVKRFRPYFSKEEIRKFAQECGVHPGIIVGQLHGRKELGYAICREMLPKIRGMILPASNVDGWDR